MPPKKPPHLRRPPHRSQSFGLRRFEIIQGLPALSSLRAELMDMTDVLLGRREPPVNGKRVEALMEVADAYFARASEITMLIQMKEGQGEIPRGHAYIKFRTSELRTFMELAKRAGELGSRRVTVAQLRFEQERTGREME